MNNANSVLLLSILLKNCMEGEKEQLIKLYQESFERTDEYKQLKEILENCSFDGYTGQELYEKGMQSVKKGLSDPDSFLSCLTTIHYVISNSRNLLEKTDAYINSPNMNNVELSVFRNENENTVRNFYLNLLSSMCYFVSALFNVELLNNCKINMNANIFDFISNVTGEIRNLIYELQNAELPKVWVIKRCSFAGANLLHYNGFALTYDGLDETYVRNNMKEISPFLLLSEAQDEVLCCGIGNIVVTDIEKAYNLINSTVKVKLPMDHFDNMDIDYNCINPLSLVKGNDTLNSYVITPNDFVDLLNRYFMLKTVKTRNLKGLCPYCGKSTPHESHYNIPRDY